MRGEGGGGVSFSVSLKESGGREIMRAREQTVQSQRAHSLTHIGYVQCICVHLSGRKMGKKTEIILCMQEFSSGSIHTASMYLCQSTATAASVSPPDQISPLAGLTEINLIFHLPVKSVVIKICRRIQSDCSCRTQSIKYSYNTDCTNHGISNCRELLQLFGALKQ